MRNLISSPMSASLARMKLFTPVVAGLAILATGTAWAADLDKIAVSVASLLQQGHYSRHKLDDEISKKLFDQYLRDLDANKLFFTQADVDMLRAKYETTLDDAILAGDLDPAREIFALFKKRVADRVASNKVLAGKKYT